MMAGAPLATIDRRPPGSSSVPIRTEQVPKKVLLHLVGVVVQVTSGLVIVSPPLPVPKLLFQPRPCSSIGAASAQAHMGCRAGAMGLAEGVAAAMSATVSSSFIACGKSRGCPWPQRSIRVAVRAFWVNVNQPICTQRADFRDPGRGVAFVTQPYVLRAP